MGMRAIHSYYFHIHTQLSPTANIAPAPSITIAIVLLPTSSRQKIDESISIADFFPPNQLPKAGGDALVFDTPPAAAPKIQNPHPSRGKIKNHP
jgi:hypothetical protein